MSKLTFYYAAMNAGKSTMLLQASHNYRQHGMRTVIYTSQHHRVIDDGRVVSRLGISSPARIFSGSTDFYRSLQQAHRRSPIACVLVDEAQFLTEGQVWGLARVADHLAIRVDCYGLRTDYTGKLFDGSSALLAIADRLQEIRSVCHCGRKATMTIRRDEEGQVQRKGDQVGPDREAYESLCRLHWEGIYRKSTRRQGGRPG